MVKYPNVCAPDGLRGMSLVSAVAKLLREEGVDHTEVIGFTTLALKNGIEQTISEWVCTGCDDQQPEPVIEMIIMNQEDLFEESCSDAECCPPACPPDKGRCPDTNQREPYWYEDWSEDGDKT